MPTTDIGRAQALVLWARSEGVAITELQVGDVRLALSDLRLAGTLTPSVTADDRQNLYRQFGGDALAQAVKEDDDSSFLEEE